MSRTIDDVIKDYKEAEKCREVVPIDKSGRIYGYANKDLRESLREEYISLLPEDKRLAIVLMKHSGNLSEMTYEINGIEDNWCSYHHRNYLEKARKALELADYETCVKLVGVFF